MISGIELQNFQGFRGVRHSSLAPITLVLGQNAVGKSSLFRALKFYSQSSAHELKYNGPKIQLLDFKRTFFGQTPQPGDFFGVQVETPVTDSDAIGLSEYARETYADYLVNKFGYPREIAFVDLSSPYALRGIGFSHEQVQYLKANVELNFFLGERVKEDNSTEAESSCGFVIRDTEDHEVSFGFSWVGSPSYGQSQSEGTLEVRLLTWDLIEGGDDEVLLKVLQNLEQLWDALCAVPGAPPSQDIQLEEIRDILSKANPGDDPTELDVLGNAWSCIGGEFVKSKSGILAEIHTGSDEVFENVTRDSLLASLLLLAHSAQSRVRSGLHAVGSQDRNTSRPLAASETLVNKWLQRLTYGRYAYRTSEIQTNTFTRQNTSTEDYVHDANSGARVSFENVGAGIGHLIPLLEGVAERVAQGATLLVEEPELHLHPAAQAELAELFVDLVISGEVGQVILETHSENMLLRLQKLVRTGRLKPSDVAVLIVQSEPTSEEDINAPRGNTFFRVNLLESGDLESPLELSFAGVRLAEQL